MPIALVIVVVPLLAVCAACGALVLRFYADKRAADREWRELRARKVRGLGSVDSLRVTPIIDWYADRADLKSEAGVSWLLEAGPNRILMDVGGNFRKEHPSPLLQNMAALGIDMKEIPHLFISHLHMDHVGGLPAQRTRTVLPTNGECDLSHVTLYAPVPMVHASANVRRIDGAEVLMPGIASEGPIARAIFLMGMTREQALVVNVRGKGLVLVVGCGHQGVRRLFERAEQLFDEPVHGLIAGLHYPVTASRLRMMGIPMQKLIGTGKLPWQNVTKAEVRDSIEFLKSKALGFISISAHDSCDWSIDEFRRAFPDTYHELRVGRPLIIGAAAPAASR